MNKELARKRPANLATTRRFAAVPERTFVRGTRAELNALIVKMEKTGRAVAWSEVVNVTGGYAVKGRILPAPVRRERAPEWARACITIGLVLAGWMAVCLAIVFFLGYGIPKGALAVVVAGVGFVIAAAITARVKR